MEKRKRVFTSFAIEDRLLSIFLHGQARNDASPFDFVDMSVKEPWDYAWKTNCRTRIKGCDGLVAIITKNTPKADGQLWEIQCAYEEGIPVMLMYGTDDRPALPKLLQGRRINIWSWDNIKTFIKNL